MITLMVLMLTPFAVTHVRDDFPWLKMRQWQWWWHLLCGYAMTVGFFLLVLFICGGWVFPLAWVVEWFMKIGLP